MIRKHPLSALVLALLVLASCQKEISFENDNTPSDGTVQSDISGACQGITVGGTYKKDTTLTTANYVDVTVTVASKGTYTIYTDTVNGYYFNATGFFTNTGTNTVRLKGSGKPLTAGTNNFILHYDSTQCFFTVNVTDASGGGGGGNAAFTFSGSPGGCTNAAVQGTFVEGNTMTITNKAVIQVNVTTLGAFSISTAPAVNGVTFALAGNFTAIGVQNVELLASGTPVAAGTFTFSLTNGTTTCTFPVTFAPPTPTPSDYFPRTANSNWSYEIDNVANDSLLVKALPNTITPGGTAFTIFMGTDDASLGFDSSGYYRKVGGNYNQWMDMGDFWGLNDPLWMEYTFLKDDQPVGHTWYTPTVSGNFTDNGGNTFPVQVRMRYKILEKDISVQIVSSISTILYPNTIVVEEEYEIFNGTAWVEVGSAGSARFFYARNVGLIQVQFLDDAGTSASNTELRRAQVF